MLKRKTLNSIQLILLCSNPTKHIAGSCCSFVNVVAIATIAGNSTQLFCCQTIFNGKTTKKSTKSCKTFNMLLMLIINAKPGLYSEEI